MNFGRTNMLGVHSKKSKQHKGWRNINELEIDRRYLSGLRDQYQ